MSPVTAEFESCPSTEKSGRTNFSSFKTSVRVVLSNTEAGFGWTGVYMITTVSKKKNTIVRPTCKKKKTSLSLSSPISLFGSSDTGLRTSMASSPRLSRPSDGGGHSGEGDRNDGGDCV